LGGGYLVYCLNNTTFIKDREIPQGNNMMDIPKGLLIYGAAQLVISLSLGILGYLRVDYVALEG